MGVGDKVASTVMSDAVRVPHHPRVASHAVVIAFRVRVIAPLHHLLILRDGTCVFLSFHVACRSRARCNTEVTET